ncbi:MAG: permease [Bacillota bacterium]
MSTVLLILGTIVALIWSHLRDRDRTARSIRIAGGLFVQTATQIAAILALVGLALALIPEEYIRELLGGSDAVLSTLFGAAIGTVTILPAFVAFPLAASLMERGAHLVAVAAFVTTLTMVGFATLPIEIRHFGRRFALLRNAFSFGAALLIALGMVVLL